MFGVITEVKLKLVIHTNLSYNSKIRIKTMEKHIKTIGNYTIKFGCYTVNYNIQNKMLYKVTNGETVVDYFDTQKDAEEFILNEVLA
jgi:hypothetical protein